MSTVRLDIYFEGPVPGVASHRLSLGQFGDALQLLLRIFRRSASDMIRDADSAQRGRLPKRATALDLELVSINEGSIALHLDCLMQPESHNQLEMVTEQLPARVTRRFLEDLEAEKQGEIQNEDVRKFLRKLPHGLTKQEYRATVNGKEIGRVEIQKPKLAILPPMPPLTIRRKGEIIGVCFQQGKESISLLPTDSAHPISVPTTPDMVELAIQLRKQQVEFLVLEHKERKLLWLRPGYPAPELEDLESRTQAHIERWRDLLVRLAE